MASKLANQRVWSKGYPGPKPGFGARGDTKAEALAYLKGKSKGKRRSRSPSGMTSQKAGDGKAKKAEAECGGPSAALLTV